MHALFKHMRYYFAGMMMFYTRFSARGSILEYAALSSLKSLETHMTMTSYTSILIIHIGVYKRGDCKIF
jgi:hypothetical protein